MIMNRIIFASFLAAFIASCTGVVNKPSGSYSKVKDALHFKCEEVNVMINSEYSTDGTVSEMELELVNVAPRKNMPDWRASSEAALTLYKMMSEADRDKFPRIAVKLSVRKGGNFVNSNTSVTHSYSIAELEWCDSVSTMLMDIIVNSDSLKGFASKRDMFAPGLNDSLVIGFDSLVRAINDPKSDSVMREIPDELYCNGYAQESKTGEGLLAYIYLQQFEKGMKIDYLFIINIDSGKIMDFDMRVWE